MTSRKDQIYAYVKKARHDSYSARLVGRAFNIFDKQARQILIELESEGRITRVQTEPHPRWTVTPQ